LEGLDEDAEVLFSVGAVEARRLSLQKAEYGVQEINLVGMLLKH
jgi:hypothetical protein